MREGIFVKYTVEVIDSNLSGISLVFVRQNYWQFRGYYVATSRRLRNSLSRRLRYSNPYIYIYVYIYRERERGRERLVSFQKDLMPNPSHSNTNIRHLNTRSTPLKLIYIISSVYKPKIKCFEYFLSIHQAAQNERPKVVSCLDICL